MLRTLLIVIVFLSACNVKSSNPLEGEVVLNDCQKRWKILELKKHFSGKVLFHAVASPGCGILATGSVTIVQTKDGNTYRVIEYCNTDKTFAIGASVVVKPETNETIPHIADDKRQCEVLKTLFGEVENSE